MSIKKTMNALSVDCSVFSDIIRLYKPRFYVLCYQIIALTITISFYFILKTEGSFVLKPMHLNVAIWFLLLINSMWIIDKLKMKFRNLVELGAFMTPIIWTFFVSTLIFGMSRMPESLMDWVISIDFLLIAVSLSFFLALMLAGIAFVFNLAFRFLRGSIDTNSGNGAG